MVDKQKYLLIVGIVLLSFPLLISAQWLETTIGIPDSLCGILHPRAFTYNETNSTIYVGGAIGKNVIAIDGVNDEKIALIPAGQYTLALCCNSINNKVYCAHSNYSVTVIDGAADSVITVIGVGDGPVAFTYNPQYNRVYVANYYGNSVSVIRDSMTGIDENHKQLADNHVLLQVYPNPAKMCFTVCLPHDVNSSTVRIFNVSETLVKSIEMNKPEAKVSLQGISSGIYFVQHDNNRTITKLVVTK